MRHNIISYIFAGFSLTFMVCCLNAQNDYIDLKQDYVRLQQEYVLLQSRLDAALANVAPPEPEPTVLAVKNNNPCNVKAMKHDTWQGQVGIDKHGHAIFDTPEHGIRAAAYVLKNYAMRHDIDTITGIVKRFATGNQQPYIKFLCKRLDLRHDEPFNILHRLPELLKAMARFESGQDWPSHMFAHYDILAKL